MRVHTRHVIVPKASLGIHRVGRSIPSRGIHIFDMHGTRHRLRHVRENPTQHSLAAEVSDELESGIPGPPRTKERNN
jgi:hypothetical protein